jgi:hypothetical protein
MSSIPRAERIAAESAALHQAVGDCILAWARVEMVLSYVFDFTVASESRVSHAVIGAVRSFEARLKMIGDAVIARFPDEADEIRTDWKLLYNLCSSQNQLRNQVAHSIEWTFLPEGPALEPFLIATSEKPKIHTGEVLKRAADFKDLEQSVGWLGFVIRQRLEPDAEAPPPIPDQVLLLRAEAAQRRAKHGRPPRSSRP